MKRSTLTERGQISVPASLRRAMKLKPGQILTFIPMSDHEFRVVAEDPAPAGPLAMLGYARQIRSGSARSTQDWMKELRAGEKIG